ncbi:hypothetical protein PR048_004553 [Dryococelus australis]|uniref:Reverse transcriptase n=1 Tax=Dryococelus australis TaxID=614101 RepID=A0ABQ9I5S1_9NEOP|nr:hypothetical protein PR048_004553 [Dryococelus australis]
MQFCNRAWRQKIEAWLQENEKEEKQNEELRRRSRRVQSNRRSLEHDSGQLFKVLPSCDMDHKEYLIICPIVLHCSKIWTTRKACRDKIDKFERRVTRAILGLIKDRGEWRQMTNEEVYSVISRCKITNILKSRRIQCAGHVIRMPDDAMSTAVMEEIPSKMCPLGRPRLRWWDELGKDLKHGRREALDWLRWRQLVKAMCGLQGL